MMEKITFDNLPDAVGQLVAEVAQLKDLLQSQLNLIPSPSQDRLTAEPAANYLGIALPTLYGLVSEKKIPHMKPGRRLYFSKKELDQYILDGKVKTISEINKEAQNNLGKQRRR